jgi:predicted N-acyltransferase
VSVSAALEIQVKIANGLRAVPAKRWDALANPCPPSIAGEPVETYNPFVSHAFLSALENSGCVGGRSGWQPMHVLVEAGDGEVIAAAPCYAKSHSQGEYVFDYSWADAYERAGGAYYPKLQVSVPFTPVTGPRLLLSPKVEPETARSALLAGLRALRAKIEASSIHLTFLPKTDWNALGEEGLLQRVDQQFHWMNEGYGSFDDFLAALSHGRRKTIRRERRDALAGGITVETLTGRDITEAHWDAFFAFYMDTGSRKWGRPYLNRRFFSLVGERMAERIVLMLAKRNGRYIAGAINFRGDATLFGRNWGAVEHHPFLHFELCYYRAMDYAIAHGLARVEAGAQGEHKLARGYRPVLTYSAHDIADPALRRAVAEYLAREKLYVAAAADELETAMPFKRCAETRDA